MSGIAGIVNLDGAPVERATLDRMAALLEYRGPDRTGVWAGRAVGLVHTLFAATEEARGEQQPFALDGHASWISADARIDGREDLIAELRGRGCRCSIQSTDPELILHAYAVWGEQCVEHLLGDFAFAIWDAAERKLFCARDHFGVKPFFYARTRDAFIFSNAFDVPRRHPGVPDDICELAIADFLVLGDNFDLERTAREAIRRLPPAHVLVVAGGEVRTRRYWTLPVDPPTVFRRSQDYVERFLDLFGRAVSDRLRTGRVAVLMSGGMDSSAVAAVAKHVADKSGVGCSLSAHTQTYHHLIPYPEGHFASLAARKIGIPWTEFPIDDKQLLGYWDQPQFRRSEPWKTPMFDWALGDTLGKPLPARVVLTGQGGDPVFSSSRQRHCRDRIREGHLLLLAKEACGHLSSEGRMRRLHLVGHIRSRLFGERIPPRPFPVWLNPDLERRLHLRERYEQYAGGQARSAQAAAAVRPEAYDLLDFPMWAGLFEEYDLDNFGACTEVRHPFFDLRLVRYVLSLPALPWCSDKQLLRHSMRGLLPDEVRLARKRPIVRDLVGAFYRSSRKPWLENFDPVPDLSRYVDWERAIQYVQNPAPWDLVVHLRPICLNYWLKWEHEDAYKVPKEECYA
ncbi:MAG TPA: asparagine synthase-related protein [Patescibacteria group bacterium]|nr:asparagine synthase-related protein [Patescibacteria group bacterium]